MDATVTCGEIDMRHVYPLPGNEDEFEEFCLRFFRYAEDRGGLTRYGKRGERQDGIDIIDQRAIKPRLAIQSKCHEPTKKIPPKEIREEVRKAENSIHSIDRYVIATTAKKSRESQDVIIELNCRPDGLKSFSVEIVFWEDIAAKLDEFDRIISDGIVFGRLTDRDAVEISSHRAPMIATAPFADSPGEAGHYSDIERLFEDRKIEAAEHEIAKLPKPECNPLISGEGRYAILRLKAKLALEKQEFDEASRLFFLAYESSPKKVQARQNRVLALELTGQSSQAFQEAVDLIDEGNITPFLLSLLVRTADSKEALAPFNDQIEEYAKTAEDINVALVHACLSWNNFDRAKLSAARAVQIAPESAHALFVCGMVAHHKITHGQWENRSEQADAALIAYSKAAEFARRDKHFPLLPEILTNRARVSAAIGETEVAAADYLAAVESTVRPSLYAEGAIAFFLHFDKYESARELLPSVNDNSERKAFFSSVIEHHFAEKGCKSNAIEKIRQIAISESIHADEACCHAVQWALDLPDTALAGNCVVDSFVERFPLIGMTLRAWIASEEGNKEAALELANNALDTPADNSHPQELEMLAKLLCSLDQNAKALPLLEQVYIPGVLDNDCKALITCAQRLERHDTILRVCNELESTGQIDNVLRRVEVQVLLRYDPEKAYKRAGQLLEYDKPYFQSVCNYAAAILGNRDKIVLESWAPPLPSDLFPEDAALVLLPLATVGRYLEALDYAYHLLRNHYSSERSHGQYVWLFLQYEKHISFSRSQKVAANTAVHLKSEQTGKQRWIVLEEDNPDPSKDEFSPANNAIASLLGKQIGEQVEHLGGPHVPTVPEKILAIESKYVYRFQNTINGFSHRFPGSPMLQPVHVGSGDNFDPTPLLEIAKDRRSYVERSMAFYRDNPCSLHFIADRLGTDIRRIMLTLSLNSENELQCVDFSWSVYEDAVDQVSRATVIVLDLSAIVTMSHLNAWSKIDSEIDLLVTHSTKLCIDAWLHDLIDQTGTQKGSLQIDENNDQPYIQEVTGKQLQDEIDEIAAIIAAVENNCTIVGAISAASVEPERRELYSEVFGAASFDSLCVAKDRAAVLWTDDRLLGVIAQAEFGVSRAWSQAVFRSMLDRKSAKPNEFRLITAKLLEWNYVSTVWNTEDLIAAGSEAEWDTNSSLFAGSLRVIGLTTMPIRQRRGVVVDFLKLLRESDCPELRRTAVIQAVLNLLDHTAVARWMYKHADQLFEIDVFLANDVRDELSYWLHLR